MYVKLQYGLAATMGIAQNMDTKPEYNYIILNDFSTLLEIRARYIKTNANGFMLLREAMDDKQKRRMEIFTRGRA